jgi:hypothetical protein
MSNGKNIAEALYNQSKNTSVSINKSNSFALTPHNLLKVVRGWISLEYKNVIIVHSLVRFNIVLAFGGEHEARIFKVSKDYKYQESPPIYYLIAFQNKDKPPGLPIRNKKFSSKYEIKVNSLKWSERYFCKLVMAEYPDLFYI